MQIVRDSYYYLDFRQDCENSKRSKFISRNLRADQPTRHSIRQLWGDDTRDSTKHEKPKMCWIVEALFSTPVANVVHFSKTINPRSRIHSLVESNFLAAVVSRSFSHEEKLPWSISSFVGIAIVVASLERKLRLLIFRMTILDCQISEGGKTLTNALKRSPKLCCVIHVYLQYICISYFIENRIVSVSVKCYVSIYLSSIIINQFIIPMHLSIKYWIDIIIILQIYMNKICDTIESQ